MLTPKALLTISALCLVQSLHALPVGPYANVIDFSTVPTITINPQQPQSLAEDAWLQLAQNNFQGVAHRIKQLQSQQAPALLWQPLQGYLWLVNEQPARILELLTVEREDIASNTPVQQLLEIRARAHLQLGALDDALQILQQLTRQNPYEAGHWIALAQTYGLMLEFDAAQAALNEAKRTGARMTDQAFVQGDLFRLQGDDLAAIASYERALRANPHNIWAQLHLTSLLLHTSREADFYRHSNALYAVLPQHSQVRIFYAITKMQTQALKEAEALLRDLQDNDTARFLLARIYYAQDRFVEAENLGQAYMQAYPEDIHVRTLLAAIALKQHQPTKAIALLSPYVSEITEDTRLLMMLGTAYVMNRELDAGLQWLSRAEALKQAAPKITDTPKTPQNDVMMSPLHHMTLPTHVTNNEVLGILSAIEQRDWVRAERGILKHSQDIGHAALTQYLRGRLKAAQGDRAGAMINFQQAIHHDARFMAARQQLAQLYMDEGDFAAASRLVEALLDTQPHDMQGLLLSAYIAEERGQVGQAISQRELAQKLHPEHSAPGHSLVLFYLRQGQAERAYQLAGALATQFPDDATVLRLYGQLALAQKDSRAAIHTFKKLTQMNPEPAVLRGLAEAYFASGRLNAATQTLKGLLADNPHDFAALRLQATIAMAQHRYDDVMRLAKHLIQEYPQLGDGYDFLGQVYQRTQQRQEAESAFEKAWAITPTSQLAQSLYEVRMAQGAHLKAMQALEAWVKQNPDDMQSQRFLAKAYMTHGAHSKAIAHYESVLTQHRQDVVALNNLALLKVDVDLEDALALAERAYQLAPGQPEIMDTYGWALFRDGQPEEAERLLERAHALRPHDETIQAHLAVVYHHLGKVEVAKLLATPIKDNKIISQVPALHRIL